MAAIAAVSALAQTSVAHADYGRVGWTGGEEAGSGYCFNGLGIGFDARVALYVSFAEKAHAEAANPLSVPALLLFALAMSLVGVEHRRSRPPRPGAEVSEARLAHEASARRVLHLVRRGLLFGLVFLIAFAPIKEVALRLFEIFAALLPLLAAVLFSMRRHHASKLLLIGWAAATGFIYMLREEGLVKSYVVYFTF